MDYQDLYYHLFRAIAKAVDELDKHNYGTAEEILKQAQQYTEELYMQEGED